MPADEDRDLIDDGEQSVYVDSEPLPEPRTVRRRDALALGAIATASALALGTLFGATVVASRVTQPPEDAELKAAVDALTEQVSELEQSAGNWSRSGSSRGATSTITTQAATNGSGKSRETSASTPTRPPIPESAPNADATTPRKSSESSTQAAVVREKWANLLNTSGSGDWTSKPVTLTSKKLRIFFRLSTTQRDAAGDLYLVPEGKSVSAAYRIETDSPLGFVTLARPSAGAGSYTVVVRIDGQFSVSLDQLQ